MALKDFVVATGFLTFATISSLSVQWEDKVYNPNKSYYVGDNQTVIDQQAFYGSNNAIGDDWAGVPSAGDITYSPSVADSNSVSSDETSTQGGWSNNGVSTLFALDDSKSWKETLEAHYASGKSFDELLKDKSPVFRFDASSSGKVFWPLDTDGVISNLAPKEHSGNIANFDAYFQKGEGAFIEVKTNSSTGLVGATDEEAYYTIRYSYISKTFANDGQDTSKSFHRVGKDDKALYYTNWTSDTASENLIPPKGLVAFAGATGGFKESTKTTDEGEQDSSNTTSYNYVKVQIWKSSSKSDKGSAITFGDLYSFK